MKKILILIIVSCSFNFLKAQESTDIKRPALGLHFFYNDFVTAQRISATSLNDVLKDGKWNRLNNNEGGFGLDYLQGLTRHIDLVGNLNASWVDYLFPDNTFNGSSKFLLDINAGVHLKMFPENYAVNPFLIAKASFNLYEKLSGFSLAPGAGIQFCLLKESFVLATIEYRAALGDNLSNQLYYSVGIATPIGKKKTRPPVPVSEPPAPPPVKQEITIPARNIVITVTDEATGQPLPYADVVVSGPEGKKLNGSTNAEGMVTFNAVSAADYTVSGMLNNINTAVQNIAKSSFEATGNEIRITLTHNDPRFTLSGVVINKTINKPEGGAEISVTNITKSSLITKQSQPGDGTFRAQLEAESDFTVVGKKADFISNIEKVSTKGLNRSATLYVKLELAIEEAKAGQAVVLNNIYFEVGKAVVKTEFSSDLDKLIQFLKDNPDTKLEIQGHTDNTGSTIVNDKLSQSRANSVVSYLTNNGIDKSRLSAKGYGSSVPVAGNATPEGRSKNRRVEMKVLQQTGK